jgi:hypothetical protein
VLRQVERELGRWEKQRTPAQAKWVKEQHRSGYMSTLEAARAILARRGLSRPAPGRKDRVCHNESDITSGARTRPPTCNSSAGWQRGCEPTGQSRAGEPDPGAVGERRDLRRKEQDMRAEH